MEPADVRRAGASPRKLGQSARNLIQARSMLEYCRFAYKAYAQACRYPLDPFFELDGEGPRDEVMAAVHRSLGTGKTPASRFDPVEYALERTPDPRRGVVYRDQKGDVYILFQPRALDANVGYARGFDLEGAPVDGGIVIPSRPLRCAHFQGRTGMTGDDPETGWRSWLGAVVYDPRTRVAVIVFRGSRSGSARRAAVQAELQHEGSADWMTDMEHFHATPPIAKYDDATLAVGFHLAYESCVRSLVAAFQWAIAGERPDALHITGHSLGGSLAQCAYLDVAMNALEPLAPLLEDVPITCYPVSAPPILLGQESHWNVALSVDATQVCHYFCRHDGVHGGPCTRSSLTRVGKVMGTTATPLHFGTEIALESTCDFPEAHEPEMVWRGMNGGATDPGFWPKIRLDPVAATAPFVTGLPAGLGDDLRAALRASALAETTETRVQHLLAVLGDGAREARAQHSVLADLARSVELVNGSSPEALEPHRGALLARYRDASDAGSLGFGSAGYLGRDDYRAIASAYWVMLQYVTAHLV